MHTELSGLIIKTGPINRNKDVPGRALLLLIIIYAFIKQLLVLQELVPSINRVNDWLNCNFKLRGVYFWKI